MRLGGEILLQDSHQPRLANAGFPLNDCDVSAPLLGLRPARHQEADLMLACEMRMQLPHRIHYPETCAYGPLGIIVMGLGIAKVDDDFLPPILGDITLKLPDDAGTCLLVGTERGVEVVRGQGPGTW